MAKEGTFQLLGQPNPDVADINKGRIFWNTITDTFQQIDENGIIKDLTSENPGGNNTNIQFNNLGTLDGSDTFVFDGTAVGIGTLTPDTSALLDLTSTTRGFLMPVMTTIERDAIPSPATGLEIYNITTAEPEFFNGSIWLNTGSTAPGGSNTEVQFNNNGTFDGISGITTDGTNLFVGDLDKINFGVGSDLQIFHGGANSEIQNLTGDLLIINQGAANGDIVIENFSATNDIINRLGTQTSATEFRIVDNLSAHLFSVAGDGNVLMNEDATLTLGELTLQNTTGGISIIASDERIDIRQTSTTGDINILNFATAGDIVSEIGNINNTTSFRFKNGLSNDIFIIGGDGKSVFGEIPESSAILTLDTTALGFLMPVMTTTQRDAIPSPATGLEIYNLTTNEPEFFDGSVWITTGGTAPGGLDTQIQFNNSGAFGGISGVTTDGANLDFANGAEARFGDSQEFKIEHLSNSTISNTTGEIQLFQLSSSDVLIRLGGLVGSTALIIQNAALTELMRIVDNGNVGIGTASPDSKLHLFNGSAGVVGAATNTILTVENNTDAFISILSPPGDARGILFGDSDSNTDASIVFNDTIANGLNFRTLGFDRMTISNSGSVGINNSNPDTTLHVQSASSGVVDALSNTVITAESPGNNFLSLLSPNGNERSIIFGEPSSNQIGSIRYSGSNASQGLDFQVNSLGSVMVIDNTGGVGIGTTSVDASALLDVNSGVFNILTGTVDTVSGNTLISGVGTGFTSELVSGQQIKINSVIFVVDSISSDSIMFVEIAPTFSGFGFDFFGSSNRGFLMPRMTTTERDIIPTPATGLEIYNLTTNEPEFFDGLAWITTGGTAPGGLDTQFQFNNNGAFDGFAGLTTNGIDTVRIDENTALKFGEVIAGLSIGHNTLNSDIVSSIGDLAFLCLQSGRAISLETNNGGVVINASIADATAELTIVSTTKGFLMPRMTTIQRDAIPTPATGLEIYNLTTNEPEFFDGSAWITTGGTAPGGSDTQVQFNDNGSFNGITGVTTGGTGLLFSTATQMEFGDSQQFSILHLTNSTLLNKLGSGELQFLQFAASNIVSRLGPSTSDFIIEDAASNELLIVLGDGNVGINSSLPKSKLEIIEDPANIIGTWTIQTSAANNEWESCTFGNNLFVAASITGGSRIMTSPDSFTWTSRTINAKPYTSITFGGGVFVAVAFGSNTVATSPDGFVWTDRTISTRNYSDIAFGNGTFVAIAENTTECGTSTDGGQTWTVRTLPEPKTWSTITFGNGTFVALSRGGGADGSAISTDDGVTWTNVGQNLPSLDYRGSTFGNGLFVAVSTTGTDRVQTSTDGITWTGRTAAAVNNWTSVSFGNGIFMAISTSGTGNRAMSSTDGITWITEATPADNSWRGIAFGNDVFVAVSTTGSGNRAMSVELVSAAIAILDLQSTTTGFLPPRMATNERLGISPPVAGLEVYDNTLSAPMFHDSIQWQYGAPVAAPNIIRVRQLSDLPTPDINDNINIIADTIIFIENSVDLGINNILPAGNIFIVGVSFDFTTLTSSNDDGTIDYRVNGSVTTENIRISNTNAAAIAISLNNSGASLFTRNARFFGEIIVSSFNIINLLETQIFSKLRFTPGATGLFNARNVAFIQFAPITSIAFEQGSNVFSAFLTNAVFITAPGGFGIVVENPDSLNVGELETVVDQGAGTLLKCDPVSSSNFTPVTGSANQGIALDADGNLIIADSTANTITRMIGLTNVVDVSIAAPSTNVAGVVWLKGDLYSSDNGTNLISRHIGFSINITGTVAGPGTAANMLTTDGTNIIVADQNTDLVSVLDGFSTTVLESFTTPAGSTLSGLTFDGINLIISDNSSDLVHVLEGISGTEQYSFTIAAGAADFVDIAVDPSGGFIGSDLAGNSIYFYDHPVTFDHSSRSWLIGSAAGLILESSDRGGSQFFTIGNDPPLALNALTQNVFQDIAGSASGIFYGSFNAMEKCRLFDENNGEIAWTGTRNRGRTVSGQVTVTRSDGGAADKFYELAIEVDGVVQKDSISIGVLPTTSTILTLSTLPITRDLTAGNPIKLQIRITSAIATTEIFAARLSIN